MKEKIKYTSIGGSALIEGVMMRSTQKTAIAVRKSGGGIVLKVERNARPMRIIPKIPILRGIVSFIQSLILSYKSMMYSADVAMSDLADEAPPETKFEKFLDRLLGKAGIAVLSAIAMILGLAIGLALFFALPTFLVSFIEGLFPHFDALGVLARRIITSVGEGVIKLTVFFLYLLAVSKMNDIKRVFQYHGAEHKTIFCFEHHKELTPENAAQFKRFHPRCGTSFLFLVLLVSIVISSFITVSSPLMRAAVRILLIPLMLGLAYECIRFAGRHDNTFTRILSAPGLWFQRLTTKEPDSKQLEIAIVALKGVLEDYPTDRQLEVMATGELVQSETEKEQADETAPA